MKQEELFKVETNILPFPKLILVFCGLSCCLLISFIDQNAIGNALPAIGKDLNAANTISWAGTSSLIANTTFQVLYGRLSDIFGRKAIFLSAVALLSIGDLACSFAKTGPQLYGFRAISGVAAGGIGALTMMIVSDVVTLENRGKYGGILGSTIGMGNVIGPFLAAAFLTTPAGWPALFWFIAPTVALAGVVVFFILPPSKVTGDPKDKIRAIDFLGLTFSTAAILLILIPVSGGGTYFAWSSPMVISMLTLGSVCAVIFLIVEWRFARMPMIPLHLFTIPAVGAILAQNFLFGIVYQSSLYYLPIYFQNIRLFSPTESAALLVPFVAVQSIFSVLSGQYISRMKRYGEVIWAGYAAWTLGAGLMLTLSRTTAIWAICLVLAVEGIGVGFIFQPTLVAAQAHSKKADRAVVIAVRNFLRSFGGAVGLALSSSVFSNVLGRHLRASDLPSNIVETIMSAVLAVPSFEGVSVIEREMILDSYMAAIKGVFYVWAPVMGTCLLLCLLIKDRGLQRPEERAAEELSKQRADDGESHEEPMIEVPVHSEAKV